MQVLQERSEPYNAYRGVNKYIDYTTGHYFLEYTKVYKQKGSATAQANMMARRSYYSKTSGKKTIRLVVDGVSTEFEWAESWTEVASEWSKA